MLFSVNRTFKKFINIKKINTLIVTYLIIRLEKKTYVIIK